RSLAREMSGEQEGMLSIGTTHTQARYVLPEVLREFRERYPKVNLELHQGTSEQIAELVAANRIDFAVATGAQQLFPTLVMLPCYQWDRIILAPKDHPLARHEGPVDLPALAQHPLITYVFSSTGESSFKRAFAEHDLEPQVVFTARDADIIKTYVRMGMGVGVVASMAFECADQKDLVAIDAVGLFPRVTTWLGFRRDTVLRGYMVDFISLFAPQLPVELVRRAAELPTQVEVDALFADLTLPLRSGCNPLQTAA
ncbi:MAG: LysR substrate-binding domain-containing protein, partial [Gammaproteobacteria bacterium]|nr:LysR substrate-binding domain-containing protein [Gammaproteobacteria bacterium]